MTNGWVPLFEWVDREIVHVREEWMDGTEN